MTYKVNHPSFRVFRCFGLLARTLCLLLAVSAAVACSDEEDNVPQHDPNDKEVPYADLSPAEQFSMTQQAAVRSVLTQLTACDTLPADFDSRTFQPTYGEVLDESQPLVRTVVADSPMMAEYIFRSLVAEESLIQADGEGLRISLKDMILPSQKKKQTLGTLSFVPGDGSSISGTIYVDIPCIPSLSRIDIIPESAWPHNAGYQSAYNVGMVVYCRRKDYSSGLYLCVKSSPSAAIPGLLVRFDWADTDCINLDEDDEGCWRPKNPGNYENFMEYVNFLATKQMIKNKVQKYLKENNRRVSDLLPGGFAQTDRCFSGSELMVVIDSWFGSYRWGTFFYYWRHCKYAVTPSSSIYGEGFTQQEIKYTADSDWEDLMKKYSGRVYTMQVMEFYHAKLPDVVLEYNPYEKY